MIIVSLAAFAWAFFQIINQPRVPVALFVGLTMFFGVAVYVLMVELFLDWGAKHLNLWRKGKWIKELEYPYLLLGTIGLYIAINRLEVMEGATRKFDLFGPILIVAAVAIKLVKVRAETNDWDKIT